MATPPRSPTRILLMGCGKTKRKLGPDETIEAKDLYTGSLFTARRKYAEATPYRWWIASAKYGLISPDAFGKPYDETLVGKSRAWRIRWSLDLVEGLVQVLDINKTLVPRDILVELHMGEAYAEYLVEIIRAIGMSATWITKGMSQGAQMHWYKGAATTFVRR
jgi:hypothetical protein